MEKPVIGLVAAENPLIITGKHLVNTPYVAALIVSAAQLLRLVLLANSRRRD